MSRALLILILIIVVGCRPSSLEESVKLFVMDCGELEFTDISLFSLDNDETPVRKMFVPCYLVDHPDGTLLWDAGLDPTLVEKGPIEENGIYQIYEKSVIDQVREIGYAPDEIDLMALSHMHFDHTGAANYFPNVRLLIQRPEHDAAFNAPEEHPIFNYSLYKDLADNPKTILDGDHDVFGDGKVLIISAPGHTPGHQVLFVDLAESGPLVLSGDLYHFRLSRAERRVPTFNIDKEQTLAAMEKVENFVAEKGATFWIEHDLALAKTLRLAPDYYQ